MIAASIVIIIISLVFNWLVQLVYYLYKIRKNPKAFGSHRTLLNYYTGYIGDGIILPIINVLIFFLLRSLQFPLDNLIIGLSVGMGILANFAVHHFQAKRELTNWSMPEPYRWNFAGKWHMISFPIQASYLGIFINTIFLKNEMVDSRGQILLIFAVFGLFFIFLLLFIKDYAPEEV